jgi:hypothetical protein
MISGAELSVDEVADDLCKILFTGMFLRILSERLIVKRLFQL